jgi:hypothetical protein
MAIYEFNKERMVKLSETSFEQEKVKERDDLQRLLRDNIDAVCPDTIVIAEEFGQWEDSSRRIDLLGLDKQANLVVFELKRTEDGGHMELQAIRYAAMVSTMTFDQVVDTYKEYLSQRSIEKEARQAVLDFLGWTEEREDDFAQDVSIVLVSADFSKELTTAVLWLNQRDLDIRCVRLKPYKHDGRLFLDIQQVVPLPEASEYVVKVKKKEQAQRDSVGTNWNQVTFLEEMQKLHGDQAVSLCEDLIEWSRPWTGHIWWGTGSVTGSLLPVIDFPDNNWASIFKVRTNATVQIEFYVLKNRNGFREEAARVELMNKLNRINGANLTIDRIEGKPDFELKLLANPTNMALFKEATDWAVRIINNA